MQWKTVEPIYTHHIQVPSLSMPQFSYDTSFTLHFSCPPERQEEGKKTLKINGFVGKTRFMW